MEIAMKFLSVVLAAIILSSAPVFADWYSGGNLHRSTASQWHGASSANRLATAADWSVRILSENRVRQLGMTGWRTYSQELADCVSAATSGGPQNQAVSEIAAACAILMDQ
jgi:hypothetical protein